ncbi:peroxisomal membrane anchor protein conserved region-domain-containing protein [Halteromyces radiatus]|uniref:peroxisomal membrane anchor protein conserved region-domain-containing protein n=1 Tax=Halteromyces radiatus TaxID=101107 RepID=UPI00221F4BE0|nr:peroxisomal membrane anchor protein conserved region-domain-containing protein [Halteromyces radiatus]KAI8076768.1 peroxisomal membrane anchor protein conserved region-domain-containing protein [Halteromyces radiatus]
MSGSNSSTPTTTTNEYREDLLMLASSFLSSSKVQAAEKSKKIAFLKSKGLTDAEITEAFRRLDQQTSISETSPQPSSALKYTSPSTSLIPEQPMEPLILYHPAPTAPIVPTQQTFALALIFGVGLTGVACGLIGIVKRLLYPVFATYAGYKHSRYQYYTGVIKKVKEVLDKDIKEEKDQDELESLDKPGVYQLISKQQSLAERLADIVFQVQSLRPTKKSQLANLHQSFNALSESLTLDQEQPAVLMDMKGELRRLKGICLNRRQF